MSRTIFNGIDHEHKSYMALHTKVRFFSLYEK